MGLPDPDHVLHVEDDDIDADLIGLLMKGQRYRVSRVRTYGEMMDFQGHPDVVLLDLRIPGSDDPIRLVQDAVRRFRSAGIILLTGLGDSAGEELSVRAMAAGAQGRLLKKTFDKRRLHLAICEAFQQRQHMLRVIEQSRSDMRVDPESLREAVRDVLSEGMDARLSEMNKSVGQVVGKLRKLGASDTEPHDTVPVSDPRRTAEIIAFMKRHQKFFKWMLGLLAAGYFALGDYVSGIRNAVFDTNTRVQQIQKDLE